MLCRNLVVRMIAVIIIAAVTCLLMILSILFFPEAKLGKLIFKPYWLIALIGAIVLIASGLLKWSEAAEGLFKSGDVNPVKILVLFLSMAGLSIFLDEVGFFKNLAAFALKKAGSNQRRLFFYLYALVSVLTVFTSNDIIILTFTPFICYFAKNAKINPVPYLLAEFTAANTWSLMLVIGNPTNIYIAAENGITFMQYFAVMALPALTAGIVSCAILYLLFRRHLALPAGITAAEDVKISDKPLLVIGLVHLSGCTVLLIVSQYIGLPMWIISLGFFVSLVLSVLVKALVTRTSPKEIGRSVRRLPWELIPFVLAMFTVVLSMEKHGLTGLFADFLGKGGSVFAYGGASFLAANLINNIPMSVFFSSISVGLGANALPAAYAAIAASNIGALLTPIGALAGIMWMSILKKDGCKFGFADFVKYGAVIAVPTMAAVLGVLYFTVSFA